MQATANSKILGLMKAESI